MASYLMSLEDLKVDPEGDTIFTAQDEAGTGKGIEEISHREWNTTHITLRVQTRGHRLLMGNRKSVEASVGTHIMGNPNNRVSVAPFSRSTIMVPQLGPVHFSLC